MKKSLFILLLSVLSYATTNAQNAYKEGIHYQVLAEPLAVVDKTKAEVLEFFWYGCLHCYRFESLLKNWSLKKSNKVNFVRVPTIWAKMMELHARMYYTNQHFGIVGKTHIPIFRVMNDGGNRLPSETAIFKYMETKHKVNIEKYKKVFKSFATISKVNKSKSIAAQVGVEGTPELLVNGKYRITTRLAGSQQQMLNIAKFLVEKESKSIVEKASKSLVEKAGKSL